MCVCVSIVIAVQTLELNKRGQHRPVTYITYHCDFSNDPNGKRINNCGQKYRTFLLITSMQPPGSLCFWVGIFFKSLFRPNESERDGDVTWMDYIDLYTYTHTKRKQKEIAFLIVYGLIRAKVKAMSLLLSLSLGVRVSQECKLKFTFGDSETVHGRIQDSLYWGRQPRRESRHQHIILQKNCTKFWSVKRGR